MSVPLDRLYNFLHDLCDQDMIIYRWFPHGSRKRHHCLPLFAPPPLLDQVCKPYVIFHDQEPLRYKDFGTIMPITVPGAEYSNLRFLVFTPFNIYDKVMLVHSEQHSEELDQFTNNGTVGVYYWSHAVIARDWYRYAEHDPALRERDVQQPFLIYNRAWAGSREYRLKFAELLVQNNLAEHCRMGFNTDDSGDYREHQFDNPQFQIHATDLESHFFNNNTPAAASADYTTQDYQQTGIEIVLETLFDDRRWHLTEKALRPIACGHPFILASTSGALGYLRGYGFETFGDFIDESYDTIEDPVLRLEQIVKVMQEIKHQPKLLDQMRSVAQRNKQRFFSKEFWDQVINEFRTNFAVGYAEMQQHKTGKIFSRAASSYSPEVLATILAQLNLSIVPSQSSGGGVSLNVNTLASKSV